MPTAALLSGGVSAFGQTMQGFQTQRSNEMEAAQMEQQGQVAATEASARIAASDLEARKAIGGVNVGAAAGGVSGNSGSPRTVNAYNVGQAFLRDTYAKYQGNLEEQQAYYAAKSKRWEGGHAATTGVLDAGSTLLTSAFTAKTLQAGNLGLPPPKTGIPWYDVWSTSSR